jgi:hypothetical protein
VQRGHGHVGLAGLGRERHYGHEAGGTGDENRTLRLPGIALLLATLDQATVAQADFFVSPGGNLLQTDPESTALFGEKREERFGAKNSRISAGSQGPIFRFAKDAAFVYDVASHG